MAVEPLVGENYATWKLQCQSTLMRDGLWELIDGSEVEPEEAEPKLKYKGRRNKALGTIILTISTKLHYLLGTPTDPKVVWTILENQFQKKTWSNVLQRRRKLHSLKLAEGGSVQEHLKQITELMDELSIVDAPVKLEDRVMYLLESLPDSMSVLVTALEAGADIPAWSVVVEKLLHEEVRQKARSIEPNKKGEEEALPSKVSGGPNRCSGCERAEALAARDPKGVRCYQCGKMGHFRRDCTARRQYYQGGEGHHAGNRGGSGTRSNFGAMAQGEHSSDEDPSLLACHPPNIHSQDQWIVDSGASSHMCNNRHLFQEIHTLHQKVEVTVGDGNTLTAVGRGSVTLKMNQPQGEARECIR